MELKNKEGLYEIWYEFDEETKFLFCELTESDKTYISEQSKKTKKTWKKEETITDNEKYFNLAIRKSLKNWEGLTNEKLVDILDSKKFDTENGWNFISENANDVIEFSMENVRMIAENRSLQFVEFYVYVLGHIEELRKDAIKKKLKN